ncbi:MAG: bifunctional 2-C-methyl-D-erythritol 4-phosphate cytidylyltransferase/2-C-methyl-D-erythritol 2,4-cyclodiphosphate synthase [Hyphomonadaceae bacterium]
MKTAAIIVAAGRGSRLGGDIPKQYRTLLGAPVLSWSVRAFVTAEVRRVVVVIDPADADLCHTATEGFAVEIVPGGATRTDSVRAGLAAVGDADVVLIHDAARPGLSGDVIGRLLDAIAAGAPGAAPALAVADSLRIVDAGRRIVGEVDRDNVVRVQTPQAFRSDVIRAAYAAAPRSAAFSDDAAVARANGAAVVLVEGAARLMKLTYPEDFAVLERLMSGDRVTCVGSGLDAHRFGPGDHVTLCGVQIAHDKGVLGHSDADAGWHALVDAILGALGEGDIGQHFPPSDPQWKGASSELFLRHAAKMAADAGARILHVDVTLVCERPKIGPHRDAMRARTAEVLGLPIAHVSVKATTTERMGFTGREEGVAAQATATLDRPA